jgi:hypothetical protein
VNFARFLALPGALHPTTAAGLEGSLNYLRNSVLLVREARDGKEREAFLSLLGEECCRCRGPELRSTPPRRQLCYDRGRHRATRMKVGLDVCCPGARECIKSQKPARRSTS